MTKNNPTKNQKEKAAPAVIEQGHEAENTPQPDELRAFVPASAAVDEAEVEEEFEEEYEDDYDDEASGDEGDDDFEDDPETPASADEKTIPEIIREYAEQDRLEEQRKVEEEKAFIEETVRKVNSMHRGKVDNGKLEIGDYLLDRVFGGDIKKAISKDPYKEATFAKIAEDPRLKAKGKTLGGWVRAAALKRDFKDQGFEFKNLTTYHYIELATVKDVDRRLRYAREAEQKNQSVHDLKEAIKAYRVKSKSDGEKMVMELEKVIRFSGQLPNTNGLADFATDLSLVQEHYTDEKAVSMRKKVKKALANVDAYKTVLSGFLANLRIIINEGEEDQPQD
jgi:hypothetical protein